MDRYSVKARIKKGWFSKPKMVFDVVRHFQYWYDSSCGNGGGDYKDGTEIVITYDIVEAAENAVRLFNQHNGQ